MQHRWNHLYGILSPIIRHPVPPKVLVALQDALHQLIDSETKKAGVNVSSVSRCSCADLRY